MMELRFATCSLHKPVVFAEVGEDCSQDTEDQDDWRKQKVGVAILEKETVNYLFVSQK